MGKSLQSRHFPATGIVDCPGGAPKAHPSAIRTVVAVLALGALGVGGATVGALAGPGPRPGQGHGHVALLSSPAGSDTTPVVTGPPPPLEVASVSPANGATGVGGTAAVTVSFSSPLAADTPVPSLTPAVAGTWRQTDSRTLSFTPSAAPAPFATETLVVPGGQEGMLSAQGARLTKGVVERFSVAGGSVLRLQQLMSIIGYSPLSWSASGAPISATNAGAQDRAAFLPPAGTFAWRQNGWPTNLTTLWRPGSYGAMTTGMVMAFEADQRLTPDGIAGPLVWGALLHAVALHQLNTGGYSFALVSETQPETLTIWHDGSRVFRNLANTGIAQAPTALGTFNVYERLRSQVMQGTNPDGSHYADPVQYVAYFNGGDAVHYIGRYSYGYPQSLGCVELPLQPASVAWLYLSYGTIVQVVA